MYDKSLRYKVECTRCGWKGMRLPNLQNYYLQCPKCYEMNPEDTMKWEKTADWKKRTGHEVTYG